MKTDTIFTVPNALSAYRILAAPVIIWSLFAGERTLFITLISINLGTDILDGIIARAFNLCTELGARLDSLADMTTFLLSIAGFWIFERDFVTEFRVGFFLIFGFYLAGQVSSLVKFGRPTSFHLYSSKILGYIQGIFIFTFFVFGFSESYFWFMVASSCLAEMEVVAVVIALPKPVSNAQTLFHILKRRTNGNL